MVIYQNGYTRICDVPLLLVIYINDIDDCVGSRILKFADD